MTFCLSHSSTRSSVVLLMKVISGGVMVVVGIWVWLMVFWVALCDLMSVVALFGIRSSLVTAVKLGANSSSIPVGNLGLKVSGAVSYDDIVKV
ncbi:hypothetical protein LWI28_025274 [Acer negundo]|uniref:Transmembrane protein n=1 Tax=Acer negundo TaxID=4023 RepID=A0AAD5IBM1_ACENE|nr:hypothetical protein LWI28_025274 [Acer negundo]